MLLVIGERVHSPSSSQAGISRTREAWRQHGLRAILRYPGMAWGPTRARLVKLLDRQPDKVINLLPPDNKSGTWNHFDAERNASLLDHWLNSGNMWPYITNEDGKEGQITHVVLCGARVAAAWPERSIPCREPGTIWEHRQIRYLVLPHPSGRNRTLQDKKLLDLLEVSIKEFFSTGLSTVRREV